MRKKFSLSIVAGINIQDKIRNKARAKSINFTYFCHLCTAMDLTYVTLSNEHWGWKTRS